MSQESSHINTLRDFSARSISAGISVALIIGALGCSPDSADTDYNPPDHMQPPKVGNPHPAAEPTAYVPFPGEKAAEWRFAYFADGTAELQKIDTTQNIVRALLAECIDNGNVSTRQIGKGFSNMPYNRTVVGEACDDGILGENDTNVLAQALGGWTLWQPLLGQN